MNLVDVSPENIEREIRSLCTDHSVKLPPDLQEPESQPETAPETTTEGGGIDSDVEELFGSVSDSKPEQQSEPGVGAEESSFIPKGMWDFSAAAASREVSQDEQVQMAAVALSGGLRMLFALGFRSAAQHLAREPVDEFARKWAVVLCKYYKGGILELLARFQEEGAAIAATVALIAAVKGAFAESRSPQKVEEVA